MEMTEVVEDEKAKALRRYDLESLALINAKHEEIAELEGSHTKAKAEEKKAKQAVDGAEESLKKIIAERKAARGKPMQKGLFDQVQETRIPLAEPLPADAPQDPLEHLWRDYPLDRLTNWSASESDISKLKEGARKRDSAHSVTTVGGVSDYIANVGGSPGYERRLTDYKGIGSAGAERIAEALAQFHGWFARGGREEFARERGLLPPLEVTIDARASGTGPDAGQPGEGDAGQPGGDSGADMQPDEPPSSWAGEEYSLAGREDEE